MSDKTLKLFVAAVISLLLIHQIGMLISGVFGMVWGLLASVIVAVVTFFSVRLAKAGGKGSFWFLLPTLLFTLVPIVIVMWRVFTRDTAWLDRLGSIGPFFVGFALPIILLLLIYFELRKRTVSGL